MLCKIMIILLGRIMSFFGLKSGKNPVKPKKSNFGYRQNTKPSIHREPKPNKTTTRPKYDKSPRPTKHWLNQNPTKHRISQNTRKHRFNLNATIRLQKNSIRNYGVVRSSRIIFLTFKPNLSLIFKFCNFRNIQHKK